MLCVPMQPASAPPAARGHGHTLPSGDDDGDAAGGGGGGGGRDGGGGPSIAVAAPVATAAPTADGLFDAAPHHVTTEARRSPASEGTRRNAFQEELVPKPLVQPPPTPETFDELIKVIMTLQEYPSPPFELQHLAPARLDASDGILCQKNIESLTEAGLTARINRDDLVRINTSALHNSTEGRALGTTLGGPAMKVSVTRAIDEVFGHRDLEENTTEEAGIITLMRGLNVINAFSDDDGAFVDGHDGHRSRLSWGGLKRTIFYWSLQWHCLKWLVGDGGRVITRQALTFVHHVHVDVSSDLCDVDGMDGGFA